MNSVGSLISSGSTAFVRWFDSWADPSGGPESDTDRRIDWMRVIPFVGMHAACFLVFVVGTSPVAVAVAVALYVLRMFGITAFYHRYFSHRAFRAPRLVQFLGAFLAATSAQRGPLWWAAHHRHHHRKSDQEGDTHSPRRDGFLWSHVGWVLSRGNFRTRLESVQDLAVFPELRFLDRFDIVAPALLGLALLALGSLLETLAPGLGTSASQMFVWGFCISTIALYHGTFTINSLAHVWGSRRFETRDDSRNNGFLSLITLGEGWHNNHHHFPGSARQGFAPWEIDLSYYALCALGAIGLVHDLRPVPEHVLDRVKRGSSEP